MPIDDYLMRNVPVQDLFRLDGRAAVVTGGAGLYGTQITTALAEAGARVVIAARNQERAHALAMSLRERGLSVVAMPLDLGDEQLIVELRDRVIAELGNVDVLVNNAVALGGGTIEQTTREDWEETSRINSTGLFLMCKHFGAAMAERRAGVIINIGSIYGVVAPDFSIYGETDMTSPVYYAYDKGGLIQLTRYLASYYARHGVRVNCLSPGGFFNDQPAEFVRNYNRRAPLGRLAGPNDLKGAIVFLASDASAYVTGINLMVDGGWTAH